MSDRAPGASATESEQVVPPLDPEPTDPVDPVDPIEPQSSTTVTEPNRESVTPGWFDDDVDMWSGHPEEPPPRPTATPFTEEYAWAIRLAVDALVVTLCCGFVFLMLGPRNIFSDTTPAGGDMGAHVWGPAYLRDELLPNFRLTGWAPAWYNGFPAYQFYMVVPSLLIVFLDWGIEGPLAVVPLGLSVGSAVYAVLSWPDRRKRIIGLAGAGLALACIGLPYGVAFKVVAVSGPVLMPLSAYLFARLAGLRFPTPAAFAAATLPFLFYRGFAIYGGNLASTLAGEFAFSMSLSLSLVYLGLMLKGFETGKYRALTAVFFALTVLCHLIPAIFAVGATVIALALRPRLIRRDLVVPSAVLAAGGAVLVLVGWTADFDFELPLLHWHLDSRFVEFTGVGLLVAGFTAWMVLSRTFRWLLPAAIVGTLLTMFWVLPFLGRSAFLNDMGWEKLPHPNETECPVGENASGEWEVCNYLFPEDKPEENLIPFFALGLLGVGLSLALTIRPGTFLFAVAVVVAFAFVRMPQDRLWNARVLPFYYLVVILLAALALSEGVRIVARLVNEGREPHLAVSVATALGVFVASWFYVGLPLGVVPLSERVPSGGYAWPEYSDIQYTASPESYVRGWANWNFTGYEGKESYAEYYDIVTTMGDVGQEHGCGRAFWEYQKELDRYGTPMALMLLPYWTDGCIGSSEGLYFEASTTTPFHFLMQAELSVAPSSAQRDLPYSTFDITRGVQHMQMMGMKYYMAISPQAIEAADGHPDLTRVAQSGPWSVYEVADSPTVQGLSNEPAVLLDVSQAQHDWLETPKDANGDFYGPSIQWFTDPEYWDVALANGGPESWQRVDVGELPEQREIPVAEVTNIDESEPDRISFDVDRVGSPVLVKTSYFPNWKVDGAEGPWRVAPNLMVVVPTDEHVELHYGNTVVEWRAYTLTLVGLVLLVVLWRRGTYRRLAVPDAGTDTKTDTRTDPYADDLR